MKVKSLQFLNSTMFVGEQAKANSETHSIRPFGAGFWLLEHRRSGRSYLVHASLVVAEVEIDADSDSIAAGEQVQGGVSRSQKPAKVPPF